MPEGITPTEGQPTDNVGSAEPEGKTFSEDYVKTLRDEAARYRTEKKTAVDEAKVATRAEVVAEYEPQIADRDSQIAELTKTNEAQATELQKLKAVVAAKVPVEDIETVAGLVQGDTEESISDSVKRVMSIYGRQAAKDRPVDPSQGQGNVVPLNGDPIFNLLTRAVSR